MSKEIYLDNSASTPLHPFVYKEMKKFWSDEYGNCSSTHQYGQRANAAVSKSRKLIADLFYCQPEELMFTSGATESNNTAIKGVMKFYDRKFKVKELKYKPHMIISAIEHPSVLESALSLERDGFELSVIRSNDKGAIDIKDVLDAIRDNTVLISLMYVNNETGIIQPIQDLGKQLLVINEEREQGNLPHIYYHVDAVQAFNYLNCRPDHLKADLLSYSGHKIYGPKGVGLLYIRNKTPMIRLIDGGHQERTLRGGTSNTTGIVGLGAAVQLHINNHDKQISHIQAMSEYLYSHLKNINGLRFNSSQTDSVPSIINIAIKGIKGTDLQMKLDMEGFATSVGAACASGAIKPSPVLLAMGQSSEEAEQGLRISLGNQNSIKEVKKFAKVLSNIINDLLHE